MTDNSTELERKYALAVLRLLYDCQNGPPLPKLEPQWKEAMDQARALLEREGQ